MLAAKELVLLVTDVGLRCSVSVLDLTGLVKTD